MQAPSANACGLAEGEKCEWLSRQDWLTGHQTDNIETC